jgi:hypothetical protein
MHPVVSKGSFLAAWLVLAGVVVASPDAAGQSAADAAALACDGGAAVSDASGVDEFPPFVTPSGALPADPGAVILDDGSVPAYCGGGDVFQVLGVTNPNVPGFEFTSVQPAYTTPADCAKFDSQGHTAAQQCLCKNCFSLEQQCDSLPGCRAIHKCELDSGCTNANTCYFAGACSSVIDLWGTGSVATALTTAIGTCGMAHGCPTK